MSENEEIIVHSSIDAVQIEDDLRVDENTTFPAGGYLVFGVDGNPIDPPTYLEREAFEGVFKREEENGKEKGTGLGSSKT